MRAALSLDLEKRVEAATHIWNGIKNRPHKHLHIHKDGTVHKHKHTHNNEHVHVHDNLGKKKSITPWILFTVFVLGPCEPLIPLLIFPAAKGNLIDVVWVSLAFGIVTIGTLMIVVVAVTYGLSKFRFKFLERWGHALGGSVVMASGILILAGF